MRIQLIEAAYAAGRRFLQDADVRQYERDVRTLKLTRVELRAAWRRLPQGPEADQMASVLLTIMEDI